MGEENRARARAFPPSAAFEGSAGVSGASRPRYGDVTIRDRGHLPYWEKDTATYFITFRLADSLPGSILEQIDFEKKSILKTARQLDTGLSRDERKRLAQLSSARIERYLDREAGTCALSDAKIAELVREPLCHFYEKRYRLLAWCIMPNHVHVVVRLFPGSTLAETLHSWKSFSAKRALRLTKIESSFWQREYYDHCFVMKANSGCSICRGQSDEGQSEKLVVGLGARAGCPRDSRRDAGATIESLASHKFANLRARPFGIA